MMKKETWKPVTISGFTGIMMGAATTYGVQEVMGSQTAGEAAEGVKEAANYDALSFKDAFEAARAEVGPGGVFQWHGNLYNTYTAAEWNAKTHQEQHQFAEQVAPKVEAEAIQDDDDVQIAQDVAVQDEDVPLQEGNVQEATLEEHSKVRALEGDLTWEDVMSVNKEDVHILGFREIEYANGRSLTMQELDVSGQRVAIIDVDKDGTPDLAMSDLNHNKEMDEGEVLDLHTGEELSFTDEISTNEAPTFEDFNA